MENKESLFDLERILKEGQQIYLCTRGFDIDLLRLTGQTNMPYMQSYPGSFCAFQSDVDSLEYLVKSVIDVLVSENCLTMVAGKDYEEAFSSIATTGKKKIYLAVTDRSQCKEIIAAGKSAGIFVDFCLLNKDGRLGELSPKRRDSQDDDSPPDEGGSERKRSSNRPEVPEEPPYTIKKSPEAIHISKIPVFADLHTGELIYDSTGTSYSLEEKVLANNGASTYKTSKSGLWVKLYDANSLNTFIESKVKRMLKDPIRYRGICWPLGIAKDGKGQFRGYFLQEVQGEPLHLSVLKKAGIEKYFPNWTKADLCILTITILDKIDYLHRNGILMGCINPAAIRVVDENTVFLTDTDNYQVEGFPSFVYNISFTPPELLGKKVYLTDLDSENFSVAELVFMLMMTGKTPYAVGISGNPEEEIQKMNFPYSNRSIHGNAALPSMWRFMWSHLTPFKDAFYETFQRGGKYNQQGTRKGTGFWIRLTRRFKTDLENPVDPESLQLYPHTFKRGKNDEFYRCAYCGVEHPRFYFSDQFFDDYRICNNCIGKQSDVSFTCVDCGKTYYYTNRTALFHKQKKEQDATWKDQKHCRDCKQKTKVCPVCGKEHPRYQFHNGKCRNCNQDYKQQVYKRIRCRNCGQMFEITNGDREHYERKGYNLPTRCPECRRNGNSDGFHNRRNRHSFFW